MADKSVDPSVDEYKDKAFFKEIMEPREGTFLEDYKVLKVIARESQGREILCIARGNEDKLDVLVKKVLKENTCQLKVGDKSYPVEVQSVYNLRDLDGVAQIEGYYDEGEHFVYVYEYLRSPFVLDATKFSMSEKTIKFFTRMVIKALRDILDRGYIPGSIRDQNFVLDLVKLKIKILDFGFHRSFFNGRPKALIEPSHFMPPDVEKLLEEGLETQDSITAFAIGAFLYTGLFGPMPSTPFDDEGVNKAMDWRKDITDALKNLIFLSLRQEAKWRFKLKQVYTHPCFDWNIANPFEALKEIEGIIFRLMKERNTAADAAATEESAEAADDEASSEETSDETSSEETSDKAADEMPHEAADEMPHEAADEMPDESDEEVDR